MKWTVPIPYRLVSSRYNASSSVSHESLLTVSVTNTRQLSSASSREYQQDQHRGYSANDSTTMPINVILTGATGVAGSGALRQAIADPEVGQITVLTRRPLDTEHEKLRVILHQDFTNYDDIASRLGDHHAALWCLGIAQGKVTKKEYDVITYDYAMAAAKAFGAANPDASFRFLFLSGQGADSSEKSMITFARVKGKTENALAKLGYPIVTSFRPGYIHPDVRTKTNFGTRLADLLAVPTYKFLPGSIINAADLGKGMLEVAKHGSEKQILGNTDIQTQTLETAPFILDQNETCMFMGIQTCKPPNKHIRCQELLTYIPQKTLGGLKALQ